MVEVSDLKIFAAIARSGSLTRAARELHTVQSNVTTRLRLLEEDLGTPLFERHHYGVTLTRAGQNLLPFARQLDALLQSARSSVAPDHRRVQELRIGTLETVAAARLPALLKVFAPAHPHVDLALETGTTRELVDGVLQHRLDGAFVAGPVELDDLELLPAFREELVLVSAPRHRSIAASLGRGRIVKLFVFRVGCSYRQRLEAYLAEQEIGLVHQHELGSLDAILGCVAAGLGIAMLPRSAVAPFVERKQVTAHRLPPKDAAVEIFFATRREVAPHPALRAFQDVLRAPPITQGTIADRQWPNGGKRGARLSKGAEGQVASRATG